MDTPITNSNPTTTTAKSGRGTKSSSGGKFRMPFGIGCFHFACLKASADVNQDTYFESLREFLLTDKLVTAVEIDVGERTVVILDEKPSEITDDISDQERLYPYIRNCLIKINFHIPHRIQKEYIGSWREPVSESIELEIDYSDGFPVAYVWVASTGSPSTAVHILWKHFKNSNPGNADIRFQLLGPSPFHVDFLTQGVDEDEAGIILKESPGYDDVQINIRKEIPVHDVHNLVRYRLTEELAVFYRASLDRVRFINRFSSLSGSISTIIDDERLRRRVLRFFLGDAATYGIAIELERLMIDREQTVSAHSAYLDSINKQFGEIVIQRKISEVFSDINEMPAERYLNIVSILRERHNNGRTNYFVVVAAIVGVLVAIIAGSFGASEKPGPSVDRTPYTISPSH